MERDTFLKGLLSKRDGVDYRLHFIQLFLRQVHGLAGNIFVTIGQLFVFIDSVASFLSELTAEIVDKGSLMVSKSVWSFVLGLLHHFFYCDLFFSRLRVKDGMLPVALGDGCGVNFGDVCLVSLLARLSVLDSCALEHVAAIVFALDGHKL